MSASKHEQHRSLVARHATSPSTVGAAMEHPCNRWCRFSSMAIAVGSRVCHRPAPVPADIRHRRCTNETLPPRTHAVETTYYPCEGVIAVGEIKSIRARQHESPHAPLRRQLSNGSACTTPPSRYPPTTSAKPWTSNASPRAATTRTCSAPESSTTRLTHNPDSCVVLAGESRLSRKSLREQFCRLTQQHTPLITPPAGDS